jgi:hypothetical protein
VATVTLARPEKLNALTSIMHAELQHALDEVAGDDAVRCWCLPGRAGRFRPARISPKTCRVGPMAAWISAWRWSATIIP